MPIPIPDGGPRFGINVSFVGTDDESLQENLEQIRGLGVDYVKQTFSYSADFDWSEPERIIRAASAAGLTLVPSLDGDPATGFAPPDNPAEFAAWAGEFAQRFGDHVSHYIIWDEPNLASHWGGQPVNPAAYGALLQATAAAVRAADPDARIVAAPLAPTSETGPDNLNEPAFLQALYGAGAGDAFDIVAAKPYGFDTGPDDRRVGVSVLNFSRIILMREVLEANGDNEKAVWAGNWGWNSLPEDWAGAPSIWGQQSEAQRSAWTTAAFERAKREWPWAGVLFLENWQPDAPSNDPRWGFSIAGRPTADALAHLLQAQPDDVAYPGFHAADPDDAAQQFTGAWQFSPDFGADIGQSGDRVRFTFWGTDVGVHVRRADYRARLIATVDGEPANLLPRDENGAALVLTAPDPSEDMLTTEWIAGGLAPGPHTLELVAERGWDQWALNGFSVRYWPPGASQRTIQQLLVVLALVSGGLALLCARRADWGSGGHALRKTYQRLSDRAQLALTGAAAAVVGVTGWMTWGEGALGMYRRLGDSGQLAATAAAAAVFYVSPWFVVFLAALGVLFVLLVLRPAWGIALVVLIMPLYVTPLAKPMFGFRFSPVEVFALTATGAWFLRTLLDVGTRARRGERLDLRLSLRPLDWAVIAFVTAATLTLPFTERLGVATNEWRVVIVEPALLYLLLRGVRLRESEMWTILDAFVLSGLVVALYGLWQYVTDQNLITAEGGLMRLRAFYGSPNNVALYLDRLLPLLVGMVLLGTSPQARRRLAYGLCALPVGAAILLTFSKGALLLGVPLSLFVVFAVRQRHLGRRAWPWFVGLAFVGLVGLLAVAQVPILAARFDLFGTTGFFRLNLWRSSLNMFADHPITGVGLDNFLYAYRGRYIMDAAWQEPNLSHPHNIVLDFATRLGLVGLIAGGWLLFQVGRTLLVATRTATAEWLPVAAGMLGAFAAMLAHGLVDHSFFLVDLAFVFYLIAGVGVWLSEQSLYGQPPAPPPS